MIRYLHTTESLFRHMRQLKRNGKRAEVAMARCRQLLEDIKTLGLNDDAVYSKRTKNGESRIKNCVKYDLGGGYRLVTIRCHEHLLFPFVGDHDETDQWIERHRYDVFSLDHSGYCCEEIAHFQESDLAAEEDQPLDMPGEDAYEQNLLSKIDESDLHRVFPGLYAGLQE